jgi:exodeoxyribonuclease V alpha subunit
VLARDIRGIGFKTADEVAQRLGIPRDSLDRARAGLEHVLLESTQSGHCALPDAELLAKTIELLEVEPSVIEQALAVQLTSGNLVWEQIREQRLIFLPHLVRAEKDIAQRIGRLVAANPRYPSIDFEKAVAWCEQSTGKQLAPSQREAVREILRNRIAIVTGGPG